MKSPARITAVYFVYLLLLLEATARIFWAVDRGVSVFRPNEILYFFYPALRAVIEEPAANGALPVLLLGGSVLNDRYGDVESSLKRELESRLGIAVDIDNLSEAGHTSLDSLYKYRALENQKYSLVVLYHGINEVRANNIHSDRFRDDYSHYSWYGRINSLMAHPETRFVALPYTISYFTHALKLKLHPGAYLPRHRPPDDVLSFGQEIKTELPFRRNMDAILSLAEERGEPITLMTFAHHVPEDYSAEAFESRSLDWGRHNTPLELWGAPDHVVAGLEVHNRVLRELRESHPEAIFIDQNYLLPKTAAVFDDACHLSDQGSALFAENILDALEFEGVKVP